MANLSVAKLSTECGECGTERDGGGNDDGSIPLKGDDDGGLSHAAGNLHWGNDGGRLLGGCVRIDAPPEYGTAAKAASLRRSGTLLVDRYTSDGMSI
jgi:hypothetical protein